MQGRTGDRSGQVHLGIRRLWVQILTLPLGASCRLPALFVLPGHPLLTGCHNTWFHHAASAGWWEVTHVRVG